MASQTSSVKKKCAVCEKEFDIVEYSLHVLEEILKQLILANITLTDIKDVTELTFQYVNDEDLVDVPPEKFDEDDNDGNENIESKSKLPSSDTSIDTTINPSAVATSLPSDLEVVEREIITGETSVKIIEKVEKGKPLVPDSVFYGIMDTINASRKVSTTEK